MCSQTPDSQLEASRSALERKAELYQKLASGHADDKDDAYHVDFVRKEAWSEEAPAASDSYAATGYAYDSGEHHERKRRGEGAGARGPSEGAHCQELYSSRVLQGRHLVWTVQEQCRPGDRTGLAAEGAQRQTFM